MVSKLAVRCMASKLWFLDVGGQQDRLLRASLCKRCVPKSCDLTVLRPRVTILLVTRWRASEEPVASMRAPLPDPWECPPSSFTGERERERENLRCDRTLKVFFYSDCQ